MKIPVYIITPTYDPIWLYYNNVTEAEVPIIRLENYFKESSLKDVCYRERDARERGYYEELYEKRTVRK